MRKRSQALKRLTSVVMIIIIGILSFSTYRVVKREYTIYQMKKYLSEKYKEPFKRLSYMYFFPTGSLTPELSVDFQSISYPEYIVCCIPSESNPNGRYADNLNILLSEKEIVNYLNNKCTLIGLKEQNYEITGGYVGAKYRKWGKFPTIATLYFQPSLFVFKCLSPIFSVFLLYTLIEGLTL